MSAVRRALLNTRDWQKFLSLADSARELGYVLRRDGDEDAPFVITRGCEELYETDSLDAIADWLA